MWEADSVIIGSIELQGLELTITENRILAKAERTLNPDTNEIVEQASHQCLLYRDLSVDDAAEGEYTFHALENLSFPSRGVRNINLDVSEDGQTAEVSTEADNGAGGLILVQYEVQRVAATGTIDDTSCASQE